jgi:hypothetical protein
MVWLVSTITVWAAADFGVSSGDLEPYRISDHLADIDSDGRYRERNEAVGIHGERIFTDWQIRQMERSVAGRLNRPCKAGLSIERTDFRAGHNRG